MAFTSITCHHLSRPAPGASIALQCRAEVFALDGRLEELVYELKSQFVRKAGKSYGRFSEDTATFPGSAWLRECRAGRLGFSAFTQKLMSQYAGELESVDEPLDVQVLFALEEIEAGHFLYVFVLEHASGVYLDGQQALADSIYLDVSGFTLAAKVALHDWEQDTSATYLSLLRARGDKAVSDAFARLLCFSDKHDIKADTSDFLQVVDSYRDTLDESTARLARTRVVDYCLAQSKAGRPVVVAELSDTLSQELKVHEPEHFTRFVEARQTEQRPAFIPDAGQLRQYVRLSGRSDSLSMSFASECLGKEVVYDPEQDVLTITKVPPALKARLLKYLQNT